MKVGQKARVYNWDRDEFSEVGIVVKDPLIPLEYEGSLGLELPNGDILWEGDRQLLVDELAYDLESLEARYV